MELLGQMKVQLLKEAGSAKTITRNNDPITSTTESFFYGSSTYFDGNGDRLVLGNASDLSFTGDFTVETWLYLPDSTTIGYPNGDRQIIGVWTGSNNDWLMTYSEPGVITHFSSRFTREAAQYFSAVVSICLTTLDSGFTLPLLETAALFKTM